MKSTIAGKYPSQAYAFEGVPQRSLRMALCLNGTVPVRKLAAARNAERWLHRYLARHYPDAIPGETGPITIVLVL